jgi:membrane dipeptidase
MQKLEWVDLATARADGFDGTEIEVEGWMAPPEIGERHNYFLLTPEPVCCVSCLPTDPTRAIEVYAAEPISARGAPMRVGGRLHRLIDDPAGWRYQLRDARETQPLPAAISRRDVMAAGASLALVASVAPAPAAAQPAPSAGGDRLAEARSLIAGNLTIDIHSHAGRIINTKSPLGGVADPMREGGMSVICLAMVADVPVTRIFGQRISAVRTPEAGELYNWSGTAFARVRLLAAGEQLTPAFRAHLESCAACHKAGEEFSVDRVHQRIF